MLCISQFEAWSLLMHVKPMKESASLPFCECTLCIFMVRVKVLVQYQCHCVCEQFNTALLSVQSFNIGLEGSSPPPPAWSVGCYLIVTKWRNTNTKSSTERPVQAWGSASTRKEPHTSWKAENASARGMSLSTVSKWSEWCIWHCILTKPGLNTNRPNYNKSIECCKQLESSCDDPEMSREMT